MPWLASVSRNVTIFGFHAARVLRLHSDKPAKSAKPCFGNATAARVAPKLPRYVDPAHVARGRCDHFIGLGIGF